MIEIKYPEQFIKSVTIEPVTDDEISSMINESLDKLSEFTGESEIETGDTIVRVTRTDEFYRLEVIKKREYLYSIVETREGA